MGSNREKYNIASAIFGNLTSKTISHFGAINNIFAHCINICFSSPVTF